MTVQLHITETVDKESWNRIKSLHAYARFVTESFALALCPSAMLPNTLGQTAKPVSVLSFLAHVIDACKRWCVQLSGAGEVCSVLFLFGCATRFALGLARLHRSIDVEEGMCRARAVMGARHADRSVQLTIFSRCSFRYFSSRRASGRDPARKRQAFWPRIPLLPQGSGMLICSEKVGVEGSAVTSVLAIPAVSLPTQLLGGLLLLSCP